MSGRLFSVEIIKSEKRADDDNKANSITPPSPNPLPRCLFSHFADKC